MVDSRFWSHVDKNGPSGCWIWTGCRIRGYGQFRLSDNKRVFAHRFAYEITNGPIPAGLTVDHRCRNPSCVNPNHMEIVTSRENTLRGIGPSALNAKKTHCPKGHPLSGNNLRRSGLKRGERVCLTCYREWDRIWHRERAA